MADFVVVGGKARKIKGRFGGENGGRKCDSSFCRRHLKLTERSLWLAELEDLHFSTSDKRQAPVSKPDVAYNKKKRRNRSSADDHASTRAYERGSSRPDRVLMPPRAVSHNSRKVVAYGDGMCIVSAMY